MSQDGATGLLTYPLEHQLDFTAFLDYFWYIMSREFYVPCTPYAYPVSTTLILILTEFYRLTHSVCLFILFLLYCTSSLKASQGCFSSPESNSILLFTISNGSYFNALKIILTYFHLDEISINLNKFLGYFNTQISLFKIVSVN